MVKEPGEAGAANALVAQLESAPTIVGKVHAMDHADVLAELELAATLARLLLIGLDEFSHDFGLRQQNRRDYSLARAPADCLFADRKSLKQLRMRLLVRLRYNIDLLDASQLIDLAIRPILAGPFVCRPRSPFLRRRVLVVLAFEAERLVAPRQFEKAEDFFEGLTIDSIGLASVAYRGTNVNLLRHLIEPAGLIATGESDKCATLGQLIQPADLERQAQRIPARQNIANGTNLDAFSIVDDVLVERW